MRRALIALSSLLGMIAIPAAATAAADTTEAESCKG